MTKRTVSQANKCEIDLTVVETPTKREVRKRIRATRSDLWQAQKNTTHNRVCWLEKNAQDIARAKGELDWQKNMKEMDGLAKERGVNRKMTSALKGSRQSLDRIEVPQYEW